MSEATTLQRLIARVLTLKPVRAFLLYSEHRGAVLADSVTYRTLFSVFAGVLLGFSVLAVWLAGDPAALAAVVGVVNGVVPGLVGAGGDALIDISDIEAPAGLTIAGIISTVGLVGAAMGAIGSLRAAIRTLAGLVTDDVLWYWVLLRNLLLAIAIGAGLVSAAGATFFGTAGVGILLGWLGVGEDSFVAQALARVITIVVVLALDTVIVALSFRMLSGLRVSRRTLWTGALLGGIGLIVLQQASGLFVGGASANPLLATFASLIALLLWLNLSSQVILIASAYIITGVEDDEDRVRSVHGASTFAQRRVRRAERAMQGAVDELRLARQAEVAERQAP